MTATKAKAVQLGDNFERALAYALHVHGGDVRKETTIPYMSHLMAVSALVLEAGGSETQAIAALLHDAAEDFGGSGRLADIKHRFGAAVAFIVESCSDSLTEDATKKEKWIVRKQRYIEHLRTASPDAVLVSLADKLHNARAISRDQQQLGDELFARFKPGKGDPAAGRTATEWYYTELAVVFGTRIHELPRAARVLLRELGEVVASIKAHPSEPSLTTG